MIRTIIAKISRVLGLGPRCRGCGLHGTGCPWASVLGIDVPPQSRACELYVGRLD